MAIRMHEVLVDDLDGATDHVTTRQFGLEDRRYEIDLSPANLERLRDALAPFIAAGRRLPKTSRPRRRGTASRRVPPATAARTAGAR